MQILFEKNGLPTVATTLTYNVALISLAL